MADQPAANEETKPSIAPQDQILDIDTNELKEIFWGLILDLVTERTKRRRMAAAFPALAKEREGLVDRITFLEEALEARKRAGSPS